MDNRSVVTEEGRDVRVCAIDEVESAEALVGPRVEFFRLELESSLPIPMCS